MKKNWPKLILMNLDAIITGGGLIATTSLVLLNVFMRYFLNSPITWSEEVATACFVWTIFMGGAVTFRNKAHLGVDIVVKHLPPKTHAVVTLFTHISTILILGALTYNSILYAINSANKLSNILQVTILWTTVPVALGFGLSLMWAAIFMVQDILGFVQKRKQEEGVV
ncbi:TRAP transporter small permease [Oscillospiraceae bacterium LTW-04]|nr:TRAP transporter small permease [Oscillospiraceae bacterium MB24-C1]